MRRTFWFVLCLFLVTTRAFAQVNPAPPLMSFQGRLAKPDGTPVADGNYSVRFSLHTALSGGAERWNQTISPVQVRNGAFSVLLNTTTGPADLWSGNLWLEIKIGTDTPLAPRQQLVTVAYAMKANSVPDNAITSASLLDGAVIAGKLADGAVTSAKIANSAVTNAKIADSAVTSPKIANDTVASADLASDLASLGKMTNNTLSLDASRNMDLTPRYFQLRATALVGLESQSDALNLKSKLTTSLQSDTNIALTAGTGVTVNATQNMNFNIDGINVLRLDDATNRAVVRGLEITGGSDVAEPFNVRGKNVRPGMVVSIDPARTGTLRVASRGYDRSVAGVISGANGVRPGLTLTQEGSVASGKHPVAMTGRVWVWCDTAQNGPIGAGDLLTTSNRAGYAMRVNDYRKAQGAVIGKAMSSLKSGKGMVLVLVNLH